MIRLKNIGMKFNLGIEKDFSFKQLFINILSFKKQEKKEFWALRNINLEINKGEVVGFIGSNGAGKSTLLKVIAGVMKPTEGTLEVDGVISPMIELGAGFDLDLTARENVFLNGAILGYSKQILTEKYDEIVEFAELQEFMEVPVKNFSSGMVARLAFSIATIVNPQILIVDEILSVGDVAFQKKCEVKMQKMISGGVTVLYVSHSIESLKKICTKGIWLENGNVRKTGNIEEICEEYYEHMMHTKKEE